MKISNLLGILVALGVVVVSQDFPSTICVSWNSSLCVAGDRALTNTQVWLTYNFSVDGMQRSVSGFPISKNKCGLNVTYELNYTIYVDEKMNANISQLENATFLFEQLEHGGGKCNCLDIYFDETCTFRNR